MTCGDIRRVITRRISPRISTSCSLKFSVKPFYGCHTTCLQYSRRNSNRLSRSCTSFFDIGTSSTASVRDSFDIVRDYYVFVRVYKSVALSVSSLYDIVRYTTTLERNLYDIVRPSCDCVRYNAISARVGHNRFVFEGKTSTMMLQPSLHRLQVFMQRRKVMLKLTAASPSFSSKEGGGGEPQE